MKPDDLDNLVLVSDPKISPNADKTVFTVTKPSLKDDKYYSNIWILDLSSLEYNQLTSGGSDHSPEWSWDGRYISFISRRTFKEDERGSELWILDLEKRYEPRLLYKTDKSISNVRWSPDNRSIAFISQVGEADEDVKVIENIPIWFNGKSFIYNVYSHLFVIDVLSGNVKQLTSGNGRYSL
jgi:acylaminoacyl-peptidase